MPITKGREVSCPWCEWPNDAEASTCSHCGGTLRRPVNARRPPRRQVTREGAVTGAVLLIILLAAVYLLFTLTQRALHPAESVDPWAGRSGTTASTSPPTNDTTAGGETEEQPTSTSLAVVSIRPLASTSSSALKPTKTNNFRATNLVDNDIATAWIEGAEGTGEGEWVNFKFADAVVLARIEIGNGYQKDAQEFATYIRPKSIKLEYSEGQVQLVELLDTQDIQFINPLKQETESLQLTILSIYPRYGIAAAALSEVRLYAQTNPQ